MVKFVSLMAKSFYLWKDGDNQVYFDVPCVKDFWWEDKVNGFLKPYLYNAVLDLDHSKFQILPYVYGDEFAIVSFVTDKPAMLIKSWNHVVKNVNTSLGYLQIVQVCQDWESLDVIYKYGYDTIDMKIFDPYRTYSTLPIPTNQRVSTIQIKD